MRELKFRGKLRSDNQWYFFELGDNSVDTLMEMMMSDTVTQFTGLTDKTGKDIYEGDIVKAPLLDPIFGDIIKDAFCNAEIKFNKGSFAVSYYKREHNIYISDLYDKIEVIGNVFDNTELLKE